MGVEVFGCGRCVRLGVGCGVLGCLTAALDITCAALEGKLLDRGRIDLFTACFVPCGTEMSRFYLKHRIPFLVFSIRFCWGKKQSNTRLLKWVDSALKLDINLQ